MHQGECLCGKVKFQITQKITDIIMCHCSECRRVQGSAFATNGNVENQNFTFLSGKDNLTEFKESDSKSRFFCQSCGSPIMAKIKNSPNHTRIRLGTITTDINEAIERHIFTDSKANWDNICDDIVQHKEW
ncbi:GFA family protein [Candidatus Thioglobus sp.]|uniref:GFA family protein n=1 Tax=Candidatus Thioglobus sp. TaxID=2026721 RepID=UPI003D0AB8FE